MRDKIPFIGPEDVAAPCAMRTKKARISPFFFAERKHGSLISMRLGLSASASFLTHSFHGLLLI